MPVDGGDGASPVSREHPSSPAARVGRALRPLVLPLVTALPPLVWVVEATRRATFDTLGRDQGIFQYVAWALGKGAKDYRDIRDVNGPLTHLIHMVLLALGGADEHRFHVLDLIMTGATFTFVGACLPGLARQGPGAADSDRAARVVERVGWAFAAWVILSAQYLLYLYWDLAQRESFFDWFLLSSVALQLYVQSRAAARGAGGRPSMALVGVAGALSVIPWFGKPTYLFFTVAQLTALLLDGDWPLSRRARFKGFALGGVAGALTQLTFLAAYADVKAFLRIYLVDVPAMYRFIWPRTASEILTLQGHATTSALALGTSVLMLGLIAERHLPRRLLAVALLPVAGLASVVLQRKGFPYHFHPVSAALSLQWLVLVVWANERFGRAERPGETVPAPLRLVPFMLAAGLAIPVALQMQVSPHLTNLWLLAKGVTPEMRASKDYLVYYRGPDFFPWEMRQTAAYLREHTRPTDKVQMYGMDPYLLFLAERLSATPYIYAYDLDADAALGGSMLPEGEGLHPTWNEAVRILAMRKEHEEDFLARLKKDPPAAFVFMDKAPLMAEDQDAWLDFSTHCAASAPWVQSHYRQTAAFGEDRVWLRSDLADSVAAQTPENPSP
jgi:hypothetical protein